MLGEPERSSAAVLGDASSRIVEDDLSEAARDANDSQIKFGVV